MNTEEINSLLDKITQEKDTWPDVNVSLKGYLDFHLWNEQFVGRCKELGIPLDETKFDPEVEESLRAKVDDEIDKFVQSGLDSTVSSECRPANSDLLGRKAYQEIVEKYGGKFTLQLAVELITEYLSKPVPTEEMKQFWENIMGKFTVAELGGMVFIRNIPREKREMIFQELEKNDHPVSMGSIEECCEKLRVDIPKIISLSFIDPQKNLGNSNVNKKKTLRCKYCHAFGHVVSECRKLKAKNTLATVTKKKQEV